MANTDASEFEDYSLNDIASVLQDAANADGFAFGLRAAKAFVLRRAGEEFAAGVDFHAKSLRNFAGEFDKMIADAELRSKEWKSKESAGKAELERLNEKLYSND